MDPLCDARVLGCGVVWPGASAAGTIGLLLEEAVLMGDRPRPARWPWALLILAAVLLPLYGFFSWSGQCVDMAPGAGESYCTSGPSIGWPAAWLLAVVGAVSFVLAAVMLVRLRNFKS